jgi:hypothetical protein
MNALGLRSIFIAASVQPITVHSLILPSNIKIQRSGSEFLDDSHVIRPAADLERWADPSMPYSWCEKKTESWRWNLCLP